MFRFWFCFYSHSSFWWGIGYYVVFLLSLLYFCQITLQSVGIIFTRTIKWFINFSHTHIYLFQKRTSPMVKAILLEPALRHYYVKFAKRQVGPIKRQSSQYWLLIGHALNQSSSTALQSRVLIHVGPLLRWDGSSGPIRLIGCSSWLNAYIRFTRASHI